MHALSLANDLFSRKEREPCGLPLFEIRLKCGQCYRAVTVVLKIGAVVEPA